MYECLGSNVPLQIALRRAECLFALVAEGTAIATGEPQEVHGARMVGRNWLVPALTELGDGGVVDRALCARSVPARRANAPEREALIDDLFDHLRHTARRVFLAGRWR